MATQSMENTDSCECGACGEYDASVLCKQCNMGLCIKCEKSHKKIPFTKDHNFKPLTKDTSHEGSASYDESGDIFCSEHPSDVVTMICDDCTEVYCSSCAHAHSRHKVVPITADIHHIQQISMESFQNMIAGFKGLGQRKKDIASHSTLCEEAENKVKAKWEEIVETGNAYVNSLCEEIHAEKKDIDSNLSGSMGGVSERLTKTDQQISRLNMIKTSAHRHIILRGIQQSTITQKLNAEFMNKSKTYTDIPTIESMLPAIGKADEVKELIKSVFCKSVSGRHADVDFSKFGLVGEERVEDSYWRICDDGVTGYTEFILFDYQRTSISVHNDSLSKITNTRSNTNITHLVKISDTQFVSANKNDVNLLDNNYQVVKKKNDKYDSSEYDVKTICSNGKNSVIECCIGKTSPYKLTINMVEVKNNDFQSTNIISFDVNISGARYRTFCKKRGNILVYAQEKEIHIIDLSTKSLKSHDVSDKVNYCIWSLSLDAPGYILVGDGESVHVYRESMEYMIKLDIGSDINGIVFMKDTLFVSKYSGGTFVSKYSGGTVLQKYKFKP